MLFQHGNMKKKTKQSSSQRSLKKFLRAFKKGFYDQKYLDWERDYKLNAHLLWKEQLNKKEFERLLDEGSWQLIAKRAVNIEAKTNLLFSFEKMALRDAVKSDKGAEIFAIGLYDYVYGKNAPQERFEKFTRVLAALPRKQTRVLTWPLQTVFGFIANPEKHIFLKPQVTKHAAGFYDFPFQYRSKPNWETYQSLISFARQIEKDFPELKPRDFIDLQSFIWVLGSPEYA
ncbi:MAG: hypothetical protein K0S32_720 [Bacteroidetes bacterium]|jgi:hypothetical protein|nr:hypothetical protein [Bacteroidota bacterium]